MSDIVTKDNQVQMAQLISKEALKGNQSELFGADQSSRSRTLGLATVSLLLITGTISFLLLIGLTPFEPTTSIVLAAATINSILILILIFLIVTEITKIRRSRNKGRSASRLHVRIIGLFCVVAAVPAILVAIIAGVTFDLGLDRWFETRTKRIVESSTSIARAYFNESTRVLMGNSLSMASNLDRSRRLYILDRAAFERLFSIETKGRGFYAASLITSSKDVIFSEQIDDRIAIPEIPDLAIELADKGEPVPIPLTNEDLSGAIFKLKEIPNSYLYTVITVPSAVREALKTTEENSLSYIELEQNRLPFQLVFALLYFGVCVIVLISAIWMGISVATRIVTPIRRLMSAANEVSTGNLNVAVEVDKSEGDLRFLGETFNEMVSDLRTQRSDLVSANEVMDERARFISAVLSGVSAAVVGVDSDGVLKIANRSAESMIGALTSGKESISLHDLDPKLGQLFERALKSGENQFHEQVSILRNGQERTLNVQVTREEEATSGHSFVLTVDDITDLVSAQRNTAWAEIARRIAHEIKNPLTPIQLSAERIKRRYGKLITEDREVFDNCTDTIIRQVGDIGKMVDEFSSFARMPTPVMKEGNLKNTLRETVFLQKVGFPEIKFDLEMPEGKVDVIYDERMISQALINLIKNAAEAVEAVEEEQQGIISITLERVGSNAVINIVDNGIGLPAENRQKLLEPYMTTREKGTGLGLPIVRKIIEDHNGKLELLDAPIVKEGGHGAMLRATLPSATESQTQEDNLTEDTRMEVDV